MKIQFILLTALMMSQAGALDQPYYRTQLQLDEAQQITKGSADVVVAVVGTGANYRLPDLHNAIAVNTGEVPGDGLDNDHNGIVDDYYGANFFDGSGDPNESSLYGVGTHASDLVAGTTRGVAPGVKILPISFMSANGGGTNAGFIRSIDYAIQREAKVILLLAGGSGKSDSALCDVIEKALRADILVIGPAGNSAATELDDTTPASCANANLLIATATDLQGKRATFANTDFTRVHVGVPGIDIEALSSTGQLKKMSGTSIAASLAAGVAGLLRSHRPDASFYEIKEAMLRGVDLEETLAGKVASHGRLNALKALQAL